MQVGRSKILPSPGCVDVLCIPATTPSWLAARPPSASLPFPLCLAAERNLFTRERNDGLYYVITYLLFKLVEELFLASLVTLPVAAWTFYGIGLQGQFVVWWLNYYVTLCNGVGEWLHVHVQLTRASTHPSAW